MPDWNEKYSQGDHTTLEPSRLLVKAVENVLPGDALDLASGAGRHSIYLAECGWQVTAVDSSTVAIDLTKIRAQERGLKIESIVADLEAREFQIPSERYDLICCFYYLQHDLFPYIRAGIRKGGLFVAAIHVVDSDPRSKFGNPAFSLQPGELQTEFSDWAISYYHEGRPLDRDHHRSSAEIIATKPI